MSKPDPFVKWTKEMPWVVVAFRYNEPGNVYGPYSMNEAQKLAREWYTGEDMFKYIARPVNDLEGMETFSAQSE